MESAFAPGTSAKPASSLGAATNLTRSATNDQNHRCSLEAASSAALKQSRSWDRGRSTTFCSGKTHLNTRWRIPLRCVGSR